MIKQNIYFYLFVTHSGHIPAYFTVKKNILHLRVTLGSTLLHKIPLIYKPLMNNETHN